jgi:hypothetical protein
MGSASPIPQGHYEVWEGWRVLGPARLRRIGLPPEIAFYEYEHFPRGRVVNNQTAEQFVIYADLRLQNALDVEEIVRLLGLGERPRLLKSDDH